MKKIRSFIAIPLPEPLKATLGKLQEGLKANLKEGVTWVNPAVMHINLKFLGEIEESQVPKIGRVLLELAAGHTPFSVAVAKVGIFPNLHVHRVLWVGVTETNSTLSLLQHQLEDALARLGIPKEGKALHFHITMGRIKQKLPQETVTQLIEGHQTCLLGEVEVDRMVLFQSVLQPSGPQYTPLVESFFRKGNL